MTKVKETLSNESMSWLYRLIVSTGIGALISVVGYGAVKIHNFELRITQVETALTTKIEKVENNLAKITPGHTTDYMELMQLRIEKNTREWVNGKFDILNTNLMDIRVSINELKNQMEKHILVTTKSN